MMITKSYSTFAASRADDHAFLALSDVSRLTEGLEDTRVVGGLMVTLLSEAYPSEGNVPRRTSDVDTAISVSIANSGEMHDRLIAAGYTASNGNRYVSGSQVVDLLVPSGTGKFIPSEHGGRAFDSAPGLALVLAAAPILHELEVTLSDGASLLVRVQTPTVEGAVVLKALATQSRNETKDLVDMHNLLLIVEQYPADEIGGWRLDQAPLTGARKDAARALAVVAERRNLISSMQGTGVSGSVLVQQIRALAPKPVTTPTPSPAASGQSRRGDQCLGNTAVCVPIMEKGYPSWCQES